MTDEIDFDHLRQWIGRSEEASDAISARVAQGLWATLDRDVAVRDGDPAPPAIHWCLAPPIVPQSQLGPDGHAARGGFLPPVPLPRRMWAGGVLEWRDQFRVGDRVTRHSRVADVAVKDGRSGRLCFVTVDHEYETVRGLTLRERQDIVYRGPDTPSQPTSSSTSFPTGRREGTTTRTLCADPVMLFRYSALTFNGHRIHYDRDYCVREEGYPGLVVHGPLQATLLVALAAESKGAPARQFEFRGVRPLFDGVTFTLNAAAADDGLSLWVADNDGHETMTATALW